MIVLGTDIGLASFGLAVVDWSPQRIVALQVETIRTPADWDTQKRAAHLWGRIIECRQHDVMVLEEQAGAWRGGSERGTTNAKAVLARVAEGIARAAAVQRSAEVLELTPAQIRSASGLPAGASKQQLAAVMARRVQQLPTRMSNHASDAVAAAVAGGARWSVLQRFSNSSFSQRT